MRKLTFLSALLLSLPALLAQPFSGSIEFKYATQNDTTTNVYQVKNKLVKLDQYSKKGKNIIEGSFLFDLEAKEIKFLNPKRKLWGKQKSETPQVISGQCVVTKGKNVKTVAGQKCQEYIVKNADENTVITYYISEGGGFTFFVPLIKLWNRKDKQSIYFGQIKGLPDGSMPMLSEERQLDNNKMLTKLEVVKINRTPPTDETFMIPKDYTKFDQ
jgi:hypothetical protein